MNKQYISKNFIYSLLSQLITISLGLAIPRLVLVGYGSEVNGLLNSVTQLIVYLNLFEAGVQLSAIQSLYKPVSIDDRNAVNSILSAVNVQYKKTGALYLLALLVLSAVYPLIAQNSTLNYWSIFFVVLFSGLGNVVLFFFQGKYKILLQAEGKNYLLTNLHTIIYVFNSITKIVCLLLGYSVEKVVFASFSVSMLQVVYIMLLIKRKYKWINLKCLPDNSALAQKNSVLIHQVAGFVFQNTDVLIITVFCGLKEVSVYSIYKLITTHLGSVISSIFNSFSFALGQLFNTDRSQYTKTIDVVEVYFSGLVFSLYTVTAILMLPFIRLYTAGITDVEYTKVSVCALFIIVELLTYSRFPHLNTINYAGAFRETLPQTLIETAINLAVSLLLVRKHGVSGVLLGTVAALLYRNIDVFLYSNRKLLNRSARKTIVIYLVDICVMTVVLWIYQYIAIDVISYGVFLTAGIILTPCVFALYYVVLGVVFRAERIALTGKLGSILFKKKSTEI